MSTSSILHRANHLVVESAQRLLCKEEEARRSFLVVPYSSPVVRPHHFKVWMMAYLHTLHDLQYSYECAHEPPSLFLNLIRICNAANGCRATDVSLSIRLAVSSPVR